MPLHLLAYDVKDGYQSVVKSKLLANGFTDKMTLIIGGARQLPDTTVLVDAIGARDAVEKFKVLATIAAGRADVVVRVVATPCSDSWVEGESR